MSKEKKYITYARSKGKEAFKFSGIQLSIDGESDLVVTLDHSGRREETRIDYEELNKIK